MASKIGTIGWIDLTVDNADEVRDFYSNVTGWNNAPVEMDDYNDYCMLPPSSENPVTGICHARGDNKDLPKGWMIYIVVEDIEKSAEAVKQNGGELLTEIRNYGERGKFCYIKDPSGSACALYQES